jgi:hypothetical protein
LVGYEIADGPFGSDAPCRPCPLRCSGRRDESFGDETIERPRPIEWDEPRHGLTVIGDDHLLAVSNGVEVTAQMVPQLSHSSFHSTIMALSEV